MSPLPSKVIVPAEPKKPCWSVPGSKNTNEPVVNRPGDPALRMLMVLVTLTVVSSCAVALIVTDGGLGGQGRAVYVTGWPLGVFDELNEPQEEPVQVTLQSTPPLPVSLVRV